MMHFIKAPLLLILVVAGGFLTCPECVASQDWESAAPGAGGPYLRIDQGGRSVEVKDGDVVEVEPAPFLLVVRVKDENGKEIIPVSLTDKPVWNELLLGETMRKQKRIFLSGHGMAAGKSELIAVDTKKKRRELPHNNLSYFPGGDRAELVQAKSNADGSAEAEYEITQIRWLDKQKNLLLDGGTEIHGLLYQVSDLHEWIGREDLLRFTLVVKEPGQPLEGGEKQSAVSDEEIDMAQYKINSKTLIIEQDIGAMKYIRTEEDGGEAVFLDRSRTNNQVGKELEELPIYSGIYRNDRTTDRTAVMIQHYKDGITDSEVQIFLDAKAVHKTYAKKVIDGNLIYVLYPRAGSVMYLWKKSDKLIIVYPHSEEYSEHDLTALARVYLKWSPYLPHAGTPDAGTPEAGSDSGAAAPDDGFDLKEAASEVMTNINAIRSREVAYYAEWNVFVGNQPYTPVVSRRGNSSKVAWDPDTRFSLLGFKPEDGVRCSYALGGEDFPERKEGYTIQAQCDLDGDGKVSIWSVTDKDFQINHSGAPF